MNKHPKPLPRQEAFHALKQLGPDVMAEIDTRLMDGVSGAKVAAWLQGELGKFSKMQPLTLKKMVERYRGKELREKTFKRIAAIQKNVPLGVVATRINAMMHMEELALIQRARLQKMLMLEEGKPMLIGATSDEIRLLKEMLLDLARVQMETGVMPRAGRTWKGSVINPNGEKKTFEWTEEHEALLQELTGVEAAIEAA